MERLIFHLFLMCVLKMCVFVLFIYLLCDLFLDDRKTYIKQIVAISGGQHVDIMLCFIRFSEMRVLSQVSFLNELFEKSKGGKRT